MFLSIASSSGYVRSIKLQQEEHVKPAMKRDLVDLSDILEGLVEKLDKLDTADLIDIAARLKPAAKACKTVDDHVKKLVKDGLNGKEGTRYGVEFKAVMKLVPTTRLNQSLLKEELPKVHAKYNEAVTDERVSFELR